MVCPAAHRALRWAAPLAAALLLCLPGAARAALLDAVLAEVELRVVTASDIALARALALFGLRPSPAPITAPEVQRYLDGFLLAQEAGQLDVRVTEEEVEAEWRAAGEAAGGLPRLQAWLEAIGGSAAWAKEFLARDLRRRRFFDLRFRAFAFVTEFDVDRALGPGAHSPAAREAARQRLLARTVERSQAEWLAEARARTPIRLLLSDPVPLPFAMPGERARHP